MRLFLVYNITFTNAGNTLEVKSQYTIESVAIKGIEKNALEYIKNMYGEYHAAKCIQYGKTVSDINNDSNLKEGGYLIKDGSKIIVVSKVKKYFEVQNPITITKTIKVLKGVPQEEEFRVVEKVKKTVKKVVKEPVSYFASFIVSSTETEVDEEVEVDEIVNKKILTYVDQDVDQVVNETDFITIKKREFETTCVMEFDVTSIEVEVEQVTYVTNESKVVEKDKKEKESLKLTYIDELIRVLEKQGRKID